MKKITSLWIVLIMVLSCSPNTQTIVKYQDEISGLWGYKQGDKIMIKPRFIIARDFNNCNIAAVADPELGNIYINPKGEKLNIPTYEVDNFLDDFSNGLARFERDAKIGFIDECGRIVIPASYEYAAPFSNNFAVIRKDFEKINYENTFIYKGGKYGVIDKYGNMVIPFNFSYISSFSEKGTASAEKDGKSVIIDSKGVILE